MRNFRIFIACPNYQFFLSRVSCEGQGGKQHILDLDVQVLLQDSLFGLLPFLNLINT